MPDDIPPRPLPQRSEAVKRLAPGVIMTWTDRCPINGDARPRTIQYRARDLSALVAHCTSDAGAPKPPFNPDSRDTDAGAEWDLKAGWDGALDMARAGWQDGRAQIRAAMAEIPGDMIISPPQLADIAGGVLDCAAHVAGDPACFDIDDDEAAGRARVARLIVPLSASCGVPASHLMSRGAAIASVIDALEAGGISCEIEAMSVHESHGTHEQVCIRHTVKLAGEPLNLDALATSICHPATFRRLHFAALEGIGDAQPWGQDAWKPANIHGGYGMPHRYRAEDLEPPATYLLPDYTTGDYSTPEKARRSIAKGMRALGFNVSFPGMELEPETK